jgi:hypothetical protein
VAAQLHEAREAAKASRTERDELRAALAASEIERVAEADRHAQKATDWEREKQRQQQRVAELETALGVACQREAVLKEAADALGLVRSSARLCCDRAVLLQHVFIALQHVFNALQHGALCQEAADALCAGVR